MGGGGATDIKCNSPCVKGVGIPNSSLHRVSVPKFGQKKPVRILLFPDVSKVFLCEVCSSLLQV